MMGITISDISEKFSAANCYKLAGGSTCGLRAIDDFFGWQGERLVVMRYSRGEAEKLARDWVMHGIEHLRL